MTDVELHNNSGQLINNRGQLHNAGVAVRTDDPTGGRLVAWATALDAAYRIGSAICQTEFAPKEFRGKPEATAAAIMHGDELGLSPLQALQTVFVVNGKPGLYARAMVALVLTHGHEVWTVEKSDAKVVVAGRRRGSTHVHEESWTTARAQKAGYASNKKYASDPQSMLYARAAADVCRQIAPDVLAGLDYTVEEIELADAPTVTVTRNPAPAKRAQRKQPTPVAEPEFELADAPTVTVTRRTETQMRQLWALSKEHGLGDAEDFKAFISQEVKRPIESTKDLTKAEAGQVIELLKSLDAATGEVVADAGGQLIPEQA